MRYLLLFVLVIAAGLGVYMYARPTLADVQHMRTAIRAMNTIIADAESKNEARDELLDRANSIRPEDLERLEALIPEKRNTEDFYVFLSGLAQAHNMHLVGIKVTDVQFADNTERLVPTDPAQQKRNFSIEVSGPYTNLRAFLGGIENNLRLMDVASIAIGDVDSAGIYTITLEGSMYYGG